MRRAGAARVLRVELTIDGGFAYIPGLAKPIVLDGAQLAASDVAELRRLCQDALATPGRGAGAQPASHPDACRYRLTLEIDGRRYEIAAVDPVRPPAVAALIDFLRIHGRRDDRGRGARDR